MNSRRTRTENRNKDLRVLPPLVVDPVFQGTLLVPRNPVSHLQDLGIIQDLVVEAKDLLVLGEEGGGHGDPRERQKGKKRGFQKGKKRKRTGTAGGGSGRAGEGSEFMGSTEGPFTVGHCRIERRQRARKM